MIVGERIKKCSPLFGKQVNSDRSTRNCWVGWCRSFKQAVRPLRNERLHRFLPAKISDFWGVIDKSPCLRLIPSRDCGLWIAGGKLQVKPGDRDEWDEKRCVFWMTTNVPVTSLPEAPISLASFQP
jgi:hypothetical protein